MKKFIIQHLGFTMEEMECKLHWGAFSQAQFEAWCRVWDWSAPRFSGPAGYKHDAFFTRHGVAAYFRRINKVRVAFGFAPLKHS
jgi:hypothetical protein